jgi:hypothetical protein
MIMDNVVPVRKLAAIKPFATLWLSFILLRISSNDIKLRFRNIEKTKLKLTKVYNHRKFNQTCILNELLPTYTNVRIHDDAARLEPFVLDFRKNLIERQIKQQDSDLLALKTQFDKLLDEFKTDIGSTIRFDAFLLFLNRIASKEERKLEEIQKRKLCNLYGGDILLKQVRDSVINLSNIALDQDMQNIFSIGMNCHLKQKFDCTRRKVEIEKLYDDIRDKQRSNTLTIENDDIIKCELERFGMMKPSNFQRDVLSKEQYQKIRDFNSNTSITVRKADKSNVFVILNSDDYVRKINDILADDQKFEILDADPTLSLRNDISNLVKSVNNITDAPKLPTPTGQYSPGYIYGNPKIHKTLHDPPFRPIISQIGTPVYDLAKKINSIIVQFLPKRYIVESSYEFIHMLNHQREHGMLASLDVENLFTNVPVLETIEIILKCVYNNAELAAPKIPRSTMQELLILCTTGVPFYNTNGDIYRQKEGVSMGSPLGPTFANFYMCNVENNIFEENPDMKPKLYARYVDDIFLLIDNYKNLEKLKKTFEENSVLKFTFEIEKKNDYHFWTA